MTKSNIFAPRHRNKGHKNGNAKLTDGQIRFIKYCLRAGMTQKRTAEIAKTSHSTVGRIATGESWEDVT